MIASFNELHHLKLCLQDPCKTYACMNNDQPCTNHKTARENRNSNKRKGLKNMQLEPIGLIPVCFASEWRVVNMTNLHQTHNLYRLNMGQKILTCTYVGQVRYTHLINRPDMVGSQLEDFHFPPNPLNIGDGKPKLKKKKKRRKSHKSSTNKRQELHGSPLMAKSTSSPKPKEGHRRKYNKKESLRTRDYNHVYSPWPKRIPETMCLAHKSLLSCSTWYHSFKKPMTKPFKKK